jgi:chorismate dehydratase
MNTTRLHACVVSYLNAVPLFWGLQHGPEQGLFDLDFMLPSKCADALRSGEAQAAILPSIEYQRIDGLKIVPGLSISSAGPVRSVLLISQRPVEQIRTLAIDTSSRTSACLVQILLERQYQVRPQLRPSAPELSAMLRESDAALMIGDPALASDFPGLRVYDLADEWRMMTGLPFVFAFWAVRNDAVVSADCVAALQQSTTFAMEHLEEIAQSESRRTRLPIPLIRDYLTKNIDFSLGERNLEGLRTFYRLAHETGLTQGVKPLEFLEGSKK